MLPRLRWSRTRLLAVSLLGLVSVAAPACERGHSSKHPKALDPAEVEQALAEATQLGREIHRRDMLAWWASDAVMAQLTEDDAVVLRGWVLDADEWGLVHFVGESDDGPQSVLLVRCIADGAESCGVERPAEPLPLSERNAAQLRAIAAARQDTHFEPTSDRYNHVVLPTADSGWAVYLIAATTDPNYAMLGRHYRFVVSADGSKVVGWRAFSKSALVLELHPAGLPEGASVAALVVSHLLDPVPTEMHVWAALNYGITLGVATDSDAMWMIEPDGSISLAE